MHIGSGIGMDFIGAGISEVGIAGGVIDNHVNIGIFKGIDHFFRLCVFLQIYRFHRKGFIGSVSFVGGQGHQGLCRFGYNISFFVQLFGGLLEHIVIRPAAQREFIIVGSVFNHRDVQQFDKLRVANAKGNIQFVVSILCRSLIGGEPAEETVRADGTVNGIADIFRRNGGSVMESTGIVDRQNPCRSVFIIFPFRGNAWDNIKVIIHFHNIFINQRADELVEVVCGNERIKAVFSVDIQRKNAVSRFSHGKVFPFRRLRNNPG